MGLFDFLKKKGLRIESETLIKRMSDGVLDYEGLPCDDAGCPKDIYLFGKGHDTIDRQGQLSLRLKYCVYKVNQLIHDVRKHGTAAYYLSPRQFSLSFRTKDGKKLTCDAHFRLDAKYIDHGQSVEFGNWLSSYVTKPSENIDGAKLSSMLDGKYPSDRLPDWLQLDGEPKIEEMPVIEDPGPEHNGGSVETLEVGARIFDRYVIERELGKGGMGKVFLAEDTQTTIEARRHVVLKVLHLENAHDPKAQEEFKKEADTLAELRNDRIAACFNSRMLGDVPILVMEYVEGVSLDDYLAERGGVLDEKETKELLLPIAEALDYAHRKNIYHLDVKPQNIIVRKLPRMGIKTCLLDFGIARKVQPDGSVTRVLATGGTPQYMSQEQRNQEPASVAMDVFALAVTAYECLTGDMPYPHGQTINHSVKPLSSESDFAKEIMRGLEIDPKNRPDKCVELINPISIPQPPPPPPPPSSTSTPPPPPPPPPSDDDLLQLRKSFENYRMMLAQSATRSARTNPEQAEWMRQAQAALRDLTKDLRTADKDKLIGFFTDVKRHLKELNTTADDFFTETVRLVELRNGLPKLGGAVRKALKNSID